MFPLRYKEYILNNILGEWTSSDEGLVEISSSLNPTWNVQDLKDENSCLLYSTVI